MPVMLDARQTAYRDAITKLRKEGASDARDARMRCLSRLRAVDYVISKHLCTALDLHDSRMKMREALQNEFEGTQAKLSFHTYEEEQAFNTSLIRQLHKANLTEGCLIAGDASRLLAHYDALSYALDDAPDDVPDNASDVSGASDAYYQMRLSTIMPDATGEEVDAHTIRSVAAQKADACFADAVLAHDISAWVWMFDGTTEAPLRETNTHHQVGDVSFLYDVGRIQAHEYDEAYTQFRNACDEPCDRGSVLWALKQNGGELLQTFPDATKILASAAAPSRANKAVFRRWLGSYISFFQQEAYPSTTDLTRLTYVLRYAKSALNAQDNDKRMPAMARMDVLRQTLPGYEKTHLKLSTYIALIALAIVLSILLAVPSGGTSVLLMGVGFLAITFKMSLATLVGVLFEVARTSWNLWRETDERGLARALGIFKEQVKEHASGMDEERESKSPLGEPGEWLEFEVDKTHALQKKKNQ